MSRKEEKMEYKIVNLREIVRPTGRGKPSAYADLLEAVSKLPFEKAIAYNLNGKSFDLVGPALRAAAKNRSLRISWITSEDKKIMYISRRS